MTGALQKRIITDERRVQNRLASKAYRQRQKEIKERLKALKHKNEKCIVKYHRIKPRPVSVSEQCITATPGDVEFHLGRAAQETGQIASPTSVAPQANCTEVLPSFNSLDIHEILVEITSNDSQLLVLPLDEPALAANISQSDIRNSLDTESLTLQMPSINFDEHLYTDVIPSQALEQLPTVLLEDDISLPLLDSLNTESNFSLQARNNSDLDRRLLGNLSYHTSNISKNSKEKPSVSRELTVRSHPKINDLHWPNAREIRHENISTYEFDLDMVDFTSKIPFNQPSHLNGTSSIVPISLNSPMPSHHQLRRISNIIAYAQIATTLKITFEQLSSVTPSSPFHQITTMSDDPKALLTAAAVPSLSLSHHLQPTLPQIMIPHYAFLDLLPFPTLRARGITMAAAKLIDVVELKRDTLNGGLICWDSGNGDKNPARDLRSWEAAPWFLNKWRMLHDGFESDIWKRSSWWWWVRGLGQTQMEI